MQQIAQDKRGSKGERYPLFEVDSLAAVDWQAGKTFDQVAIVYGENRPKAYVVGSHEEALSKFQDAFGVTMPTDAT